MKLEGDDRVRSFACACCRIFWDELDIKQRYAVGDVESYLQNRRIGIRQLLNVHVIIVSAMRPNHIPSGFASVATRLELESIELPIEDIGIHEEIQLMLANCIAGTFEKQKTTSLVCSLKLQLLFTRDEQGFFDKTDISILTDALEDDGFYDPELVAHLRQPDVKHCFGCAALEALR